MSTTPATPAATSLALFDDGAEQPQVLTHQLDGDWVTVKVTRERLVACLDDDLSTFDTLDDLVESTEELVRQASPRPSRTRAHAHRLHRCAVHARDLAQNTIAVLHHIRAALLRAPVRDDLVAAAAVAHAVLHGALGSGRTPRHAFAARPLRLPSALDVFYDALTCQVDMIANLSGWLRAHACHGGEAFCADVERLRRWVDREPDLRAPDQLTDSVGTTTGSVVHRHARPAMPRLADRVAAGCDYETLTAEQLTAVHTALLAGLAPGRAAAAASTTRRTLSVSDVVSSVVRFGIWCQQSLLSGQLHPWVAAALGVDHSRPITPAGLHHLIHARVSGGAEQTLLVPDASEITRISSSWFDPAVGAAPTPVRIFAALFTPAVGAWYQIVRGDVHDLLGYTPMRQVHYAALLGHVAAGGTLSEYAAQQGRRYRDVLDAWDRMIDHARAAADATSGIAAAVATLPTIAERSTASRIAEIVRCVTSALDDLGSPVVDGVGQADAELVAALGAHNPAGVDHAYATLRSRMVRLVEHLRGNPLPRDPALWNPEQIDTFYSRWPDLASTVVEGVSPRAAAIDTIRSEVYRLVASPPAGAPVTAVELLTELHHVLGAALRTATTPQLPPYWRLQLGPSGADEHVWGTFVDWPDIVTVVATAKQLAADAPYARASSDH